MMAHVRQPSGALAALLLAAACGGMPSVGSAQEARAIEAYPDKPVRVVIPYAAGGPTDVVARTIGQRLNDKWGQPFLLDNRSGANGFLGMTAVAAAAPDGYTLLLGGSGVMSSNPALYTKLPYDSEKDYAPILMTSAGPFVLVTHPAAGLRDVAALLGQARARPGAMAYGSGGGLANLAGILFQYAAGIRTMEVPYKGAAPAMTDLLGGQITYIFTSTTAALPNVKAGKLVALGVTTKKRWPTLPDIPAIAETVPGFEDVVVWYGYLAPARTPRGIIMKLNREINAVLQEKEVAQRLSSLGSEPVGGTPEEFGRTIGQEIAMWRKLAREANLKLETP